jgi:hypothetical protein
MEKNEAPRLNIASDTRKQASDRVEAAYEIMNDFDKNATVHECIYRTACANLQMQAATVLAIQDLRDATECVLTELRHLREEQVQRSK